MTPHERARTGILTLLGARNIFLIALLAVLVALPAIRGEFVGGDDHRLVLNHVLVNQPTFAHAVELFKIVHRDLYQPLPLLTFQIEFLIGRTFNLFADGANAGAWLFHLDNMILHAVDAVLVAWFALMIMQGIASRSRSDDAGFSGAAVISATVAGILFAVHPFQVEVIAWINGRMMLLSTLFALLAALTFLRFLDSGRPALAVVMLACVLLSCISKVRAPLPILLGIVALATGHSWKSRRLWIGWIPAAVVVGVFVLVNIDATAGADLFSGGAEKLHGPSAVRVILAIAFYFHHLLLPIGLCSYYPTPTIVSWGDAATLQAIVTVGAGGVLLAYLAVRVPACRLAVAWCAFALADTLPFFPARNVLAADRYMYLPMVGVALCIAQLVATYLVRPEKKVSPRSLAIAGCAVVAVFVATGWRIADAYTTPTKKSERIAMLHPEVPRVWDVLGWCHYNEGRYADAIACADRELEHDDVNVQSQAHQLWGASLIAMGKVDEGLALLHKASELDPSDLQALQRLGKAYDDLGRYEDAIGFYERVVRGAPNDNPTMRRLALLQRRYGRLAEARAHYQQVLVNNEFDVEAAIGLAELAIESGSASELQEAGDRLARLLEHIPGDARLTSNLQMVRFLSRDADENMRMAARAFVALSDGRYGVARDRVELLAGDDPSMQAARGWLREAIGRLASERPSEFWTYGLITRILIADGELELARTSLGIFEQACGGAVACGNYVESLRALISAGDTQP